MAFTIPFCVTMYYRVLGMRGNDHFNSQYVYCFSPGPYLVSNGLVEAASRWFPILIHGGAPAVATAFLAVRLSEVYGRPRWGRTGARAMAVMMIAGHGDALCAAAPASFPGLDCRSGFMVYPACSTRALVLR
ncbi:hypothetical protein [Sinosporangium siamense]|uniref:hypothetical protein n=1 Tax=Sinosporangium siamense TaxID=1367973 RepID=UPI00194F5AB7|nr:hypothetical protein [Sinosporangium siamense]